MTPPSCAGGSRHDVPTARRDGRGRHRGDPYHKRGKAPLDEDGLRLQAIVEACEDAGVDPADIDGFSTYGHDADATALAPALGTRRLRWASQVAGGGGGGLGAALLQAPPPWPWDRPGT
ncbi:hypothetical protein ACR6C2_42930 [Streptomyces sp. INA 01156]